MDLHCRLHQAFAGSKCGEEGGAYAELDLSHSCLTLTKIGSILLRLPITNPDFFKELSAPRIGPSKDPKRRRALQKKPNAPAHEEDHEEPAFSPDFNDDDNVQAEDVLKFMQSSRLQGTGLLQRANRSLVKVQSGLAEELGDVSPISKASQSGQRKAPEELGRGKRKVRKVNKAENIYRYW